MIRELVMPRLRMSEVHEELSGETTFWIVELSLEEFAGYTIHGGGDPDRFLVTDGRLVVAPSVAALLAGVPPVGRHAFWNEPRFARFSRLVRQIELFDDAGGYGIPRFDFRATMGAVREREVLAAPHAGMAADCLAAALDLGCQYGERSPGYQLVRRGPLDTLNRALWGEVPKARVDYPKCAAAFGCLIGWIEDLVDPGSHPWP